MERMKYYVVAGVGGGVFAAGTAFAQVQGASPGLFVTQLFDFAMLIGGFLAFGMIVWGGVEYAMSAGNPSVQSDAKDRVQQAVLGLLLLIGSILVLDTISPNIKNAIFMPLTALEVPKSPEGVPAQGECADPAALAKAYNVPFPRQADPRLTVLLSCIQQKAREKNIILGSMFTYEADDRGQCNYTRGERRCGPCQHAVHSCHYGGSGGTQGALAVDFGFAPGETAPVTAAEEAFIRTAAKECNPGAYILIHQPPEKYPHAHVSHPACGGI